MEARERQGFSRVCQLVVKTTGHVKQRAHVERSEKPDLCKIYYTKNETSFYITTKG